MSCWGGGDGGVDFLKSSGLRAEARGVGWTACPSVSKPSPEFPLAMGGRAVGRRGKGEEAPSTESTKCSKWAISVGVGA